MLGVQPTYEMPPPATIYGHICSTLGNWVEPEGILFAYHFTYQSKLMDLEHIHVLAVSSGKLSGTTIPKVLEGNINPFKREILYMPRLVLYLNRPEWEPDFRSPHYAVVLGRSQDLCTYSSVSVVDLAQSETAYFEHTLLPYASPLKTPQGVVLSMPRRLDYANKRKASFESYVMLNQRVRSSEFLRFGNSDTYKFWVDPTATQIGGLMLGLMFHGFV